MLRTIKLGKELRPHAKWGFYDFPLCQYQEDLYIKFNQSRNCLGKYRSYNNQ